MAVVNHVVLDTGEPDGTTADPASPVSVAVVLPGDLIEMARGAAVEEAGAGGVGDYLGARTEDSVATSVRFAATDRGYRGWYWLVTVAVVEPSHPTISEVVLLPGDGALLAPAWVPWDQRVRAGDVGVGDLLPTRAEDDRLVPGYLDSDDPAVREVDFEFGFGRIRVLGREGRDDAAQRWHSGAFGPDDPMAKQAPAACATCGFYVRLEGLLGQAFGACSNEFSPADGRVVDAAYGCGAHSETVIDAPMISASTAAVMDEVTLEVHLRPATGPMAPAATLEPDRADPTDGVLEDLAAGDGGHGDGGPDEVVAGDSAGVTREPAEHLPGTPTTESETVPDRSAADAEPEATTDRTDDPARDRSEAVAPEQLPEAAFEPAAQP